MPVARSHTPARPAEVLQEETYAARYVSPTAQAVGAMDRVVLLSLAALKHYLEPLSRQPITAEQRFRELADRWREETGHLTLVRDKVAHPAYLAIIAMGESGLPFIIRELEREPGHWFAALKAIAGYSPVKPENKGKADLAAADWIEWAKAQKKI